MSGHKREVRKEKLQKKLRQEPIVEKEDLREPEDDPVEDSKKTFSNNHFEKVTAGWNPRSRYIDTRDMESRSTQQRDIDYYSRLFERESIAKTYVDPEITPAGYVTMWARYYHNGVVDSTNMNSLQRKGWEFCRPDEFPQLAFTGDYGTIQDDNDKIVNNELVFMKRPAHIHELEMSYRVRDVKRKDINNFVRNDPAFSGMQPFSAKKGMENTNYKKEWNSTDKARELSVYI